MAYNVPLSSLTASDGNVTYDQNTVLKVGQGSNITVSSSLYENNGNVGIGTATPTQKLHVVGNIQITNVASSQSSIRFPDGSSFYSANSLNWPTSTYVQTSLGVNVNVGTGYTNLINTGSVGAAGQTWLVTAYSSLYDTNFPDITMSLAIYDGASASYIASSTESTGTAGKFINISISTVIQLTASTTFYLQAISASSNSTAATGGTRIIAIRLA